MTDWLELTRRSALASHRLIGWIYWDPTAIANYAALGVPDGAGYYVATRGATLGDAGNDAVTAAFYSIHPAFVAYSLDLCRAATTFVAAAQARDDAVAEGLRTFVPEICDGLVELAEPLWDVVDGLPLGGRVLFASTRSWPRSADPLVSAWLAVNSIREWRGDTHWALHVADDIGPTEAGVLDGAWRSYADDWLPRSRGADDGALRAAFENLEHRGLASDGRVTRAGIEYRQDLEDRLDQLCRPGWASLGAERCHRLVDLIEPVGRRLVERIDRTAGPNWMPAARDRPTT